MKAKALLPLLLLLPLISAVGCDTQTADNSTSPTTPTAPTITEPLFSGTLKMGGTQIFTFSVQQIGPLTVVLNSAGPPPNVTVGLAIGTPTFSTTGTVCTPIQTVSAIAGVGAPQISGTPQTTGPYCIVIFDQGTLPNDITFAVTVAHT
jgi:hypothetical protein